MRINAAHWLNAIELDDHRIGYLFMRDNHGFDCEDFAGASDCYPQMAGIQSEIGIKRPYQSDQIKTYGDAGFDITGLHAVSLAEPLVEIDCCFHREVER